MDSEYWKNNNYRMSNIEDMPAKKKQTTVTLDKEVMDFLQEQIKTKRFSSVSHGINFALYKLMKEEEKKHKTKDSG
jgi:Arc/MetJ-type ribon-helix-helix transcriptional regulator